MFINKEITQGNINKGIRQRMINEGLRIRVDTILFVHEFNWNYPCENIVV